MKLLETPRLYLRPFTPNDAQALFELDSDPEVMRFISKGLPTPLARIENEYMPRFLNFYLQSPPRGFWAAHWLSTNEFLGWFHLRPDKFEPHEMELGYRLKRSAWGQGVATELSKALIRKGFSEWHYPKISARTLPLNLASRRVMEKAGLHFECEFTYGPDMLPDWTEAERRGVKYGLARSEYTGDRRD